MYKMYDTTDTPDRLTSVAELDFWILLEDLGFTNCVALAEPRNLGVTSLSEGSTFRRCTRNQQTLNMVYKRQFLQTLCH